MGGHLGRPFLATRAAARVLSDRADAAADLAMTVVFFGGHGTGSTQRGGLALTARGASGSGAARAAAGVVTFHVHRGLGARVERVRGVRGERGVPRGIAEVLVEELVQALVPALGRSSPRSSTRRGRIGPHEAFARVLELLQ